MSALREAYPLTWPEGQARTSPWRRKPGQFHSSFAQSRDDLLRELRLLGASEVIISSNIPLRRDGLPYANEREPDDPGIAVYFQRRGKPHVLACDAYDRAWKNLRGLCRVVEALRAIERHGSPQLMEQAFRGFAALPAHVAEPSWWDVLGVAPNAPLAEVEAAHERLAQQHHPDRGGDHDQMARINRARDIAREERGSS